MDNNTNNAKKSKILNIIIVILALALIVFVIVGNKGKDKAPEETNNVPEDTSVNGGTLTPEEMGNAANIVPEPTGEWIEADIKGDVSFDIPENYYVSYPVIGGCDEVISISSQTATDPTVPIALIFKDGCVKNEEVLTSYSKRVEKDVYIFQASAGTSSVLSVFDRIVASAEVK
jgi:hypothetical protein